MLIGYLACVLSSVPIYQTFLCTPIHHVPLLILCSLPIVCLTTIQLLPEDLRNLMFDRHAVAQHVARCSLQLQQHTHTSTCWKISKIICRLAMGREVQAYAVQLSEQGPLILLQRAGEMVVPHMDALLLAFGCNNCTTTVIEASHDMATSLLSTLKAWLQTPADQRGPCPLDALDNAIDQAHYLAHYIGKDQSDVYLEGLLRAAYQLTQGAVGEAPPPAAPHQPSNRHAPQPPRDQPAAAEHLLKSAIHAATGQSSHPFAMMAFRLLGHPTAMHTWTSVPLDPRPYIATVLTGGVEHVVQPFQLAQPAESQHTMRTVRWSDDYMYRSEQLDGTCYGVYILAMCYRRRRVDPATQEQLQADYDAQRRAEQQQQAQPAAAAPGTPHSPVAAGTNADSEQLHPSDADDVSSDSDGGAPQQQPHSHSHSRLTFQPAHPLHLTHMLICRRKPVVPRLLATPPQKPDEADVSAAAQEWYAWNLALFHPFRGRLVEPPATPKTVWSAFYEELQWKAGQQRQHPQHPGRELPDQETQQNARSYLELIDAWQYNAATLGSARERARARARLRRAEIRRAERQACHPIHSDSDQDSQVRSNPFDNV